MSEESVTGKADASGADALEARIEDLRGQIDGLKAEVRRVFLGQDEAVEMLLASLMAGGHALIEGAPGLGKTTLARALAEAMGLTFRRIQFTPDLMPADVIGTRVLEEGDGGAHRFRFEKGPVFTHVLLADEINRATPRTQSALLEAMQESQVTIFGETLVLEAPFFVIATQNPVEMEGTYPLPEAQLDRFLCKIDVPSPGRSDLEAILNMGLPQGAKADEKGGAPVIARTTVIELTALTRQVPVSSELVQFVTRAVLATDPRREESPEGIRRCLRYGASPRGGQSILALAQARALLRGRVWVSEEDVRCVAPSALRHRLVFGYEGEASGTTADALVAEALEAAIRG